MKKITVTFKQEFEEGEFDRLSGLVITEVREAFAGTIVHLDANRNSWDDLVVHAYGFDLDEGPKIELSVIDIVGKVVATGEWKNQISAEETS